MIQGRAENGATQRGATQSGALRGHSPRTLRRAGSAAPPRLGRPWGPRSGLCGSPAPRRAHPPPALTSRSGAAILPSPAAGSAASAAAPGLPRARSRPEAGASKEGAGHNPPPPPPPPPSSLPSAGARLLEAATGEGRPAALCEPREPPPPPPEPPTGNGNRHGRVAPAGTAARGGGTYKPLGWGRRGPDPAQAPPPPPAPPQSARPRRCRAARAGSSAGPSLGVRGIGPRDGPRALRVGLPPSLRLRGRSRKVTAALGRGRRPSPRRSSRKDNCATALPGGPELPERCRCKHCLEKRRARGCIFAASRNHQMKLAGERLMAQNRGLKMFTLCAGRV
ncbi:uncharacterized protein LOC118151569 [Callithrix jacchus]